MNNYKVIGEYFRTLIKCENNNEKKKMGFRHNAIPQITYWKSHYT